MFENNNNNVVSAESTMRRPNIKICQPPDRAGASHSHRRSPLARRLSHDGTTRVPITIPEDDEETERNVEKLNQPSRNSRSSGRQRRRDGQFIVRNEQYLGPKGKIIVRPPSRCELFVKALETQQSGAVLSAIDKETVDTRRYVLVHACAELGQKQINAKKLLARALDAEEDLAAMVTETKRAKYPMRMLLDVQANTLSVTLLFADLANKLAGKVSSDFAARVCLARAAHYAAISSRLGLTQATHGIILSSLCTTNAKLQLDKGHFHQTRTELQRTSRYFDAELGEMRAAAEEWSTGVWDAHIEQILKRCNTLNTCAIFLRTGDFSTALELSSGVVEQLVRGRRTRSEAGIESLYIQIRTANDMFELVNKVQMTRAIHLTIVAQFLRHMFKAGRKGRGRRGRLAISFKPFRVLPPLSCVPTESFSVELWNKISVPFNTFEKGARTRAMGLTQVVGQLRKQVLESLDVISMIKACHENVFNFKHLKAEMLTARRSIESNKRMTKRKGVTRYSEQQHPGISDIRWDYLSVTLAEDVSIWWRICPPGFGSGVTIPDLLTTYRNETRSKLRAKEAKRASEQKRDCAKRVSVASQFRSKSGSSQPHANFKNSKRSDDSNGYGPIHHGDNQDMNNYNLCSTKRLQLEHTIRRQQRELAVNELEKQRYSVQLSFLRRQNRLLAESINRVIPQKKSPTAKFSPKFKFKPRPPRQAPPPRPTPPPLPATQAISMNKQTATRHEAFLATDVMARHAIDKPLSSNAISSVGESSDTQHSQPHIHQSFPPKNSPTKNDPTKNCLTKNSPEKSFLRKSQRKETESLSTAVVTFDERRNHVTPEAAGARQYDSTRSLSHHVNDSDGSNDPNFYSIIPSERSYRAEEVRKTTAKVMAAMQASMDEQNNAVKIQLEDFEKQVILRVSEQIEDRFKGMEERMTQLLVDARTQPSRHEEIAPVLSSREEVTPVEMSPVAPRPVGITPTHSLKNVRDSRQRRLHKSRSARVSVLQIDDDNKLATRTQSKAKSVDEGIRTSSVDGVENSNAHRTWEEEEDDDRMCDFPHDPVPMSMGPQIDERNEDSNNHIYEDCNTSQVDEDIAAASGNDEGEMNVTNRNFTTVTGGWGFRNRT